MNRLKTRAKILPSPRIQMQKRMNHKMSSITCNFILERRPCDCRPDDLLMPFEHTLSNILPRADHRESSASADVVALQRGRLALRICRTRLELWALIERKRLDRFAKSLALQLIE